MKAHAFSGFSKRLLLISDSFDLVELRETRQIFVHAAFVAHAFAWVHETHHSYAIGVRGGQNRVC